MPGLPAFQAALCQSAGLASEGTSPWICHTSITQTSLSASLHQGMGCWWAREHEAGWGRQQMQVPGGKQSMKTNWQLPEQLFCLPPAQCARSKARSGLAAGKRALAACGTDPIIDYMPLVSCNKGTRAREASQGQKKALSPSPWAQHRYQDFHIK